MEIAFELRAIQEMASDLVVVSLFQGVTEPGGAAGAVDNVLGGAITDLITLGDFAGKLEQMTVLYTQGTLPAKRVLVVGLGERETFSLDVVRRVSAVAAREVARLGVSRYHSVVHGAGSGGLGAADAAQAVVEGTILGSYRFEQHKTEQAEPLVTLEALTLVEYDESAYAQMQQGARIGEVIAEATNLARDLANQPANYMTPTLLAEEAERAAQDANLRYEVLEEAQMAELGMGALLGVAQGSNEPAKFIILEHNAGRDDLDTYVIVGKGITFDSGGLSIKPSEGMEGMKYDMSGAAVALGVLKAAAMLDLPLHVVGLIPATENLPGGRAYKPGDVLEAMSGLTIEVISTDAEGRLILADALTYAARYVPKAVVDLATLTGACVIALGHVASGLMGNDKEHLAAIKSASEKSGEKVWELPLFDEYAQQIKSDVADAKNVGGRPAGTITAGLFLKKFAQDYPWAHLDIAGTATSSKTFGYTVKGCTGHGVRLLVQWLRDKPV